MMAAFRLLLAATLTLSLGCNSETQSIAEKSEHADLLDLIVPATETGGEALVDVITSLNARLKNHYPGHPNLPLVIERHDHPNYDSGDQKIDFNLPEQTVAERIQILSEGTLTHWRRSENGFVIFKTWHRPQYTWDDEPVITKDSEPSSDGLNSSAER